MEERRGLISYRLWGIRTRSCLSEVPPTVQEWEKICCTNINLTLAELVWRSATELILWYTEQCMWTSTRTTMFCLTSETEATVTHELSILSCFVSWLSWSGQGYQFTDFTVRFVNGEQLYLRKSLMTKWVTFWTYVSYVMLVALVHSVRLQFMSQLLVKQAESSDSACTVVWTLQFSMTEHISPSSSQSQIIIIYNSQSNVIIIIISNDQIRIVIIPIDQYQIIVISNFQSQIIVKCFQ